MRYPSPLVEGTFLRRYKRFLVDVRIGDEVVTAHCANTGSMRACTAPDAPVRLSFSSDPKRKLAWSLEQIRVGGRWIVVNTARPNAVVAEAVAEGRVPELAGYDVLQREKPYGERSRIDLLLLDGGELPPGAAPRRGRVPARRACWVEVKNVTLVEDDVARFPDAVTERGTRHLRELAAMVGPDSRAVLFLHVGHEGGDAFRPADDIDPVWGRALREAMDAGVEVIARRCRMDREALTLGEPVPITIPGR